MIQMVEGFFFNLFLIIAGNFLNNFAMFTVSLGVPDPYHTSASQNPMAFQLFQRGEVRFKHDTDFVHARFKGEPA
jgi:hypothetical protein